MVFRVKRVASLTLALIAAVALGSKEVLAAAPAPLALCAADTYVPPAPAAPTIRPAAQVRHFERPGITFSANTTVDGAIQVEGRGGDLSFRKKVFYDGRFTVELEAPRDKVALALSEHAITITRGKKTIKLTPEGSDDDFDNVRRLLADSRAVRLLRSAGAAFEATEDDSAAAASLLLADALVGVLTGDVGAPRRVSNRLTRHARAQMRPVAAGTNCYYQWEQAVVVAQFELLDCYGDVGMASYLAYLCSARWYLQVESYWFTLLTCSGFRGF